jgi:hypothetical protein
MDGLNKFESAVLAKLLAGDHPLLVELRSQAERSAPRHDGLIAALCNAG